ncbi:Peroxinectin A [Gracilariopsis chorda]|uniref:Peroxinectin A n=1 Tax=Gracilariopsis chorda TaxID=448386 RepID=A0A2V3IE98_9FLOR|nr:Peroxinectin A [Gracilariopsis chorda]|eukprot:PXF40415.1 Peroxinectin A [Gracilariopsis chorda]
MTSPPLFFHFCVFFFLVSGVYAQAPRPNGRDNTALTPLSEDDADLPVQQLAQCNQTHFRTYDGSCNNLRNPLWAAAGTAQFTYHPSHTSTTALGSRLPSARLLSNILSSQSSDLLNNRFVSEFTVFFGQFLDHTIVATPVNQSESMPIPIPHADPIFSNFSKGTLPFHRSVRAALPDAPHLERPINSLSSLIDLSSVYGADDLRTNVLRSFSKGEIRTSPKGMLQLNTQRLRNAPSNQPHFFLAGDHRANEHPMLTALHILFVREHNRICRELKAQYPRWDDERLFQNARHINIAQFQKVVYEEFIPAMTGRYVGRYYGYLPNVNPTVSLIFSTAAYRVGHTMVGNSIHRLGKGLRNMPSFQFTSMFFRPSTVMNEGIEPFLRGSLYHRAQEVDLSVHDALRNFLFTGIPQESGVDLVALNIQRGRDHALPTYNKVRQLMGRRPARTFADISRDPAVQSKLATAYGTVNKVELWPGLVAEDHVHRASMGPTMLRIWHTEFARLRDGDRFYYRRWQAFPLHMWWRVPSLRRFVYSRRSTMREILIQNTGIASWEVPRNPFFSGGL